MCADIEFGKCDVCGKEAKHVQRTYFRYNIRCECHSPFHFEVVFHCPDCVPKEPLETRITLKTEYLKYLSEHEYQLQFCEKCLQMTNHLDNKCQKCKAKDEKAIHVPTVVPDKKTLIKLADYLFKNFSNVNGRTNSWRAGGRYTLHLNDYAEYHTSKEVVGMFLDNIKNDKKS